MTMTSDERRKTNDPCICATCHAPPNLPLWRCAMCGGTPRTGPVVAKATPAAQASTAVSAKTATPKPTPTAPKTSSGQSGSNGVPYGATKYDRNGQIGPRKWKEKECRGSSELIGLYSLKTEGQPSLAKAATLKEFADNGGHNHAMMASFGNSEAGYEYINQKKLYAMFFDVAYWRQEKWKTDAGFKRYCEHDDLEMPKKIDYYIEGVPVREDWAVAKCGFPKPSPFMRCFVGGKAIQSWGEMKYKIAGAHKFYTSKDADHGPRQDIKDKPLTKHPWEVKSDFGKGYVPQLCNRCYLPYKMRKACYKCNQLADSEAWICERPSCNQRHANCLKCGGRMQAMDCGPAYTCERMSCCKSTSCIKCGTHRNM